MNYFLTLAASLALVACSPTPPPDERLCYHVGGMEVQACLYELPEVSRLDAAQGVMLLGWLREEAGTLYIEADDVRIRVDSVGDPAFEEVRSQMVGRYVRVTGTYQPEIEGLAVVGIRYRTAPDGAGFPPLEP